MQFIRVTRVSQGGWPSRCMHDYVYGGGYHVELVRCREPGPPSMGRVSGPKFHPTAPKGHGEHGRWSIPTARLKREPLLVLQWGQGHWGAGPVSYGVGTMGYMLGCSQPRW